MDGDFNNWDDPEGDASVDDSGDWLDSAQDGLADTPEGDLGDGGSLRPWRTTDI